MENLSDVEFGSDKSNEEAPILVAQRYLNIFRQVHIFKKEKRDQFDDELLALPQNVTDFFKRMPGGRLLVEHIEDVKTQRGISFVKTNRDEFTNGSDSETPVAAPTAIAPVAGGNLVMDSSFAETFAKSLAEAFKQSPIVANQSSGVTIPSDLGKSFELIADEIKTSRSSLLDVLKETRSITDTVISSQVTISKMLENLLASQRNNDGSINDLNNRILASQATITKLLENLCHNYSSNIPTTDISANYLEERLSQFRQQIRSEIEQSLSEKSLSAPVISNASLTEHPLSAQDEFSSDISVKSNLTSSSSSAIYSEDTLLSAKKKKKKKKKKNNDTSLSVMPLSQVVSEDYTSGASVDTTVNSNNTLDDIYSSDGVIKNEDYKFDDDFSNIDLNEPPFDADNDKLSTNEQPSALSVFGGEEQNSLDNTFETSSFSEKSDIDDDLDFSLPAQGTSSSSGDEQNSFMNGTFDTSETSDGLEFSLPESPIVSSPVDAEDTGLDSFMSDSDLDFSLPTENEAEASTILSPADTKDTGLDSIMSGNDLDFSLPAENETETSTISSPADTKDTGLDSFMPDSDLDFSLPAENETEASTISSPADTEYTGLDSIMSDSDLDFSLPAENEIEASTISSPTDTGDTGLDSFMPDSDFDFSLPAKNEAEADTTSSPANTEDTGLDNSTLSNNTDEVHSDDNLGNLHSRYSAELDKIRQALTSDNIDISSLDTPIALDDYSGDDENLSPDDENTENNQWEYDYVEDTSDVSASAVSHEENQVSQPSDNSDDEWDWEYVDENGNIVPSQTNDEDWEWEYVEDDNEQQPENGEDENKKE